MVALFIQMFADWARCGVTEGRAVDVRTQVVAAMRRSLSKARGSGKLGGSFGGEPRPAGVIGTGTCHSVRILMPDWSFLLVRRTLYTHQQTWKLFVWFTVSVSDDLELVTLSRNSVFAVFIVQCGKVRLRSLERVCHLLGSY
jgi:hypothetical protein